MSKEDLRDHFSKKQNEIKKIEEGTKKKENYIKDRTNKEYAPKIDEIELKLNNIRNEFNQIIKTIDELDIKKKELKKRKRELIIAAQPLRKNLKNITKDKIEILNKKLKAITKEKVVKTKAFEK